MDDLSALLSEEETWRCRSCKQWLAPMHGALKTRAPFHALSPRGIRQAIEQIADERAHACFECHDCAKSRRTRKIVFWLLLGGLAGAALVYGEIQSGRWQWPG